MLNEERSLSVLMQTKLTLVIAHGHGHNPIRATGLVLAHIEHICHQTKRDVAQVWDLKLTQKSCMRPWDALKKIAARKKVDPSVLYNASKMPDLQSRRNAPVVTRLHQGESSDDDPA